MSDESVTGKTVLVTGGAGFIGSHLVEELVQKAGEVRVLDDLSAGRRERLPDGVRLFEGDVRDDELVAEAMSGVDHVFHLAAQVSVDRSVEDPAASHATNVGGTLAVLEVARKVDARVIIASSAAVYGEPEAVPVAEDSRKDPRSPYGLEKLTADRYARLYHELYGLETAVLRYFNVYGPRQSGGQYSGVIDTFVRQALSGEPLTVHGDGKQTRDFVHIADVVRATLAAAESDKAVGESVNVGTGRVVSVRELADTLVEVTDSDSEIVHTEPRPEEIRHSQADMTKAASVLDFEAAVSIESGLHDVVERHRRD